MMLYTIACLSQVLSSHIDTAQATTHTTHPYSHTVLSHEYNVSFHNEKEYASTFVSFR